MAEYSPFSAEAPEDDDDDTLETSSSSSKKKPVKGLGRSLFGSELKKDTETEKPVPRNFGEALSALLGDKKDKEKVAEEARTKPWDAEPASTESSDDTITVSEQPSVETSYVQEHEDREVVPSQEAPSETSVPTLEEVPVETGENENEATEEEEPLPEEAPENADGESAEESVEEAEEDEPAARPTSQATGGSTSSGSSTGSGSGPSGAGSSGAGGSTGSGTSGSGSSASGTGTGSGSAGGSPGGGGTPTPPTPPTPPFGGGPPPGSPGGPGYNAPPTVTTANLLATPGIDPEEEYRRGHRRGFRKGLIGGLLIGGGIEHIRHKRREKRMEKAHDIALVAKDKELESEQERQRIAEKKRYNEEYWAKKKAEREAHEADQVNAREKANEATKLRQAEELAESREAELQDIMHKAEKAEPSHVIAPVFVPVERQRAEGLAKPAVAEAEPEIVDGLDTLEVRGSVEQSAWHRVELDSRGRPVQDAEKRYGKEYRHERAQENLLRDEPQHVPTAAGEVAMVASALRDQKRAEHLERLEKSAGITTGSAEHCLKHANQNGLAHNLKRVLGPPTTPLATLIWFILLVLLAFLAWWFMP